MANIKLRLNQSVPLTFQEMDDNLTNLNNDKLDAPLINNERVVAATEPVVFQGDVSINGQLTLNDTIISVNANDKLCMNGVPLQMFFSKVLTTSTRNAPYVITTADMKRRLDIETSEPAGILIDDTTNIPIGSMFEIFSKKSDTHIQTGSLYYKSISCGPYSNCCAIQTDNKIIIGGSLGTVNDITVNNLVRLNADGTNDTSFTGNAPSEVFDIAIQPDGKILVAGNFGVRRLNSNGSRDNSFVVTVDDYIKDIELQTDGKIVIVGPFTSVNGVSQNWIARLNTNGTLDTSFTPIINNSLDIIKVQPDGKILIVGYFTTVNSLTKTEVARLNSDGSTDNSFTTNINGDVRCIAFQSTGKILISGYFSVVDGVSKTQFARLNIDGTLDADFNTSINSHLRSILVQSDDKIIILGAFTIVNNINVVNICRLNYDGSLDTFFSPKGSSFDSPNYIGNTPSQAAVIHNQRLYLPFEISVFVIVEMLSTSVNNNNYKLYQTGLARFKKINSNTWSIISLNDGLTWQI